MNLYKNGNYLDHNLSTIANFQPKDEIWIIGNRFIQVINPNTPFFNEKTILHRIINTIISLSLRLTLAIGRSLTGQHRINPKEKIIDFLNRTTFSEAIAGSLEQIPTKERGCLLESLGKRKNNLEKIESLIQEKKLFDLESIEFQGKNLLEEQITSLEKSMLDHDNQEITRLLSDIQKKEKSSILFDSVDLAVTNVKNHLNTIYSEAAVERAMKYYGFDERFHLSGTDFIALVIGIVTNFTKEDFPDKDEGEILKNLKKLRSIQHRAIVANKKMPYKSQLAHDQKLLDVFLMTEEYRYDSHQSKKTLHNQEFRKHAYAEFLARHVSYALHSDSKAQFADGILFSMYDENGNETLKQATNILSHKGLHSALVKPVFPDDEYFIPCQLLFRGTSCIDSVFRDIHPFEAVHYYTFDGPGRVSFEKQNKRIFENTLEAMKGLGNCELEFIGHSLGGCDSQRAMEYFTKEIAESGKRHGIRYMNLKVFNSPNIESDIAKRFIGNVQKLPKIQFDLHFFDVRGDVIQEFGVKRLGFCGQSIEKTPENLKISVVKFDRKLVEKVQNFFYNTFARISTFFGDPVVAHTSYPLKLHENLEEKKINTMFIHNVSTNNPDDFIEYKPGRTYGHHTKEELDDVLMTSMGRFGRRISRKIYDLTRGYFGRKHAIAT